jgi:hypothetical protein
MIPLAGVAASPPLLGSIVSAPARPPNRKYVALRINIDRLALAAAKVAERMAAKFALCGKASIARPGVLASIKEGRPGSGPPRAEANASDAAATGCR